MATGQEILHLKLMSYKNKGKTYVRAYRNKWIAPIPEEAALGKKGRSVPAVQIQVGVIQSSGMVKMSSKFLSLHPEFAQQDWYYLNHDLVDENTFFDQLPAESVGFPNKKPVEENVAIEDTAADGDLNDEAADDENPEDKEEGNFKFFLPHYALKGLAIHQGIVSALAEVFDSKHAEQWISYAIYQILKGGSADCYSDWAYHQILPSDPSSSGSESFRSGSNQTASHVHA
ncbi:hypothetical protein [Parasutterella sp.]|uniref:hypothetical protein n=1 Tax=Parasutterella sp. TaxID=2049037 RepID=UPI00307C3ADC